MRFDFESEDKVNSGNKNVSQYGKTESEWKTAKYTRKKYGDKDNKTLQYLRRGLVILLVAYVLKMGGQMAYEAGYNSDFTQHFWDRTNEGIAVHEERAKLLNLVPEDSANNGGER